MKSVSNDFNMKAEIIGKIFRISELCSANENRI